MPLSVNTSTKSNINSSVAIGTVDEVELAGINESIRAIIFPKSDSAVHSFSLQSNKNKGVIWPIKNSIRLLSPCEDGAHDVIRHPGAILLSQSREKEKFTLGASMDNDIVLEHVDSDSSEYNLCYINLVHIQLYPDPDHDALILYNSSTSIFGFKSIATPQVGQNILPSQETRLGRGSWQLSFGTGLDFQIKVVSRPHKETHQSWSLISPPQTPVKHSAKGVRTVLRKNENVPPPLVSTVKEGSEMKKTGVQSSTSLPTSLDQHKIIFKTTRTLVYKATYKNTVVAIKMCRGSSLHNSAKNWRNELEILTRLDHVSNVGIPTYCLI
jgi:hypothetical protein